MRSIAELEKRIHYLEKENQYLKNLLAGAGISYSEKEMDGGGNEYDPDQELYQGTLRKPMHKCSLACFGDVQMYIASVP